MIFNLGLFNHQLDILRSKIDTHRYQKVVFFGWSLSTNMVIPSPMPHQQSRAKEMEKFYQTEMSEEAEAVPGEVAGGEGGG